MHLGMAECCIPFSGHWDLDLWLSFYSNHNVRPSVRPASCPVHISYILWDRNSKFDVWMHHGMAECRILFSGHCDLDLWPSFKNNCVRSISLILFEVGISNFVCGCIFRWGSVAYHNWVTVTLNLTSDLVSRNCIESGAYSHILCFVWFDSLRPLNNPSVMRDGSSWVEPVLS